MARKYAELWARIANREDVTIRCHVSAVPLLKKAVMKEKWLHSRARKATDIPSYGRLITEVLPVIGDTVHVRLSFRLTYSGDNL